MMNYPILYEDEYLQVINKPANLICEPENFPRLFLCHRLDKDTTGVLVLAKTKEVLDAVQRQFKERVVKKTYKAIVYGTLKPRSGVVSGNITRMKGSGKFGISVNGGRQAETSYKVLEHFEKDNYPYSLVELEPKTGRTHQVRVHLQSLGHPVVGDSLYASRRQLEQSSNFCTHQELHAYSITFNHPVTNILLYIATDFLFGWYKPVYAQKTPKGRDSSHPL